MVLDREFPRFGNSNPVWSQGAWGVSIVGDSLYGTHVKFSGVVQVVEGGSMALDESFCSSAYRSEQRVRLGMHR